MHVRTLKIKSPASGVAPAGARLEALNEVMGGGSTAVLQETLDVVGTKGDIPDKCSDNERMGERRE